METPRLRKNLVSYLQARDPSIISGYVHLESVKVVLAHTKFHEYSSIVEIPNFVQVFLRIKETKQLITHYEFDGNRILCHLPEKNSTSKEYKFDQIFGPTSTQEELFNSIIKPKLFHFINGKSSTLLTYGASGSGKTFTIFGTTTKPGIIPRTFEYLFRTLSYIPEGVTFKPDYNGDIIFLSQSAVHDETKNRKELLNYFNSATDNRHLQTYGLMQQRLSTEPVGIVDYQPDVVFSIWVSFAEIYNESVYDLLKPKPLQGESRSRLVLGSYNGQTFIKNLTSINVTNGLEAYQILQYGLHNLKYAETSVNLHSSRSHSIFTIKLLQGSKKDKNFTVSVFNFCDLAGSERVKKTLNVGERLKESNYINTSLHVLGRCIKTLRDSQKNNENKLIPFRESKLTQLFQHELLGFEDIAMIININPDVGMFDETQHALSFSINAREVQLAAKDVNKAAEPVDNFRRQMTQKLKDRVALIQLEMEEQKIRHEEEKTNFRLQTLAEIHEASQTHTNTWADTLKQVNQLCNKESRRKLKEAQKDINRILNNNENNSDSSEGG